MRESSQTLTRMGKHTGSLEALRVTRPEAVVLTGNKGRPSGLRSHGEASRPRRSGPSPAAVSSARGRDNHHMQWQYYILIFRADHRLDRLPVCRGRRLRRKPLEEQQVVMWPGQGDWRADPRRGWPGAPDAGRHRATDLQGAARNQRRAGCELPLARIRARQASPLDPRRRSDRRDS